MPILHVIYYSWPNTSGNHSGMAYLVNKLKDDFPDQIRLIEIPKKINGWHPKLRRIFFYLIIRKLRFSLKRFDKILFMEYLGNASGNQTGMALKLRNLGVKNEIYGLVHLPSSSLIEIYGGLDYIKAASDALDKIITFGSSLSDFFSELGFKEKILETFHYVDTDFYKPSQKMTAFDNLQVIHMGSLKRNFNRLRSIIEKCPSIQFHICQGINDISGIFKDLKNVKLYEYLEEPELLKLMQSCDVSLSILYDTIGSNVITTSLACGLVNVVSDVGSIKNYCDENNSLLCRTNKDFITSLNELNKNPFKLKVMKQNSIIRSQEINYKKFKKEFSQKILFDV